MKSPPHGESALWADALIDALVAGGVRRLVLSPGSRSTPLALATLRHSEITLQAIVNERSAAYFALGLARRSGEPVALAAAASGTVHWYPAVIEAATDGVPLILLSVDRADDAEGCRTNPSARKLFGDHLRAFQSLPHAGGGDEELRRLREFVAHALEQSRPPGAGPVQINLPMGEPPIDDAAEARREGRALPKPVVEALRLALPDGALLFAGGCDLGAFGGGDDKAIELMAHRGVDGNLSILLGLAAAGEGEIVAPVVGLLEARALLHDPGGLSAAQGLDATIVVIDDGGRGLPQAEWEALEEGGAIPHPTDPQRLAELHGLPFDRVAPDELYPVLKQSLARPGVDLIEVVSDAEESGAVHGEEWEFSAS